MVYSTPSSKTIVELNLDMLYNLTYFFFTYRRAFLVFAQNNPEAKEENFYYLEWFAKFYASMKLHKNQKQGLKKSQVGVLVSTYSMIRLVTQLLEDGQQIIYTSKTTNNALENLFR